MWKLKLGEGGKWLMSGNNHLGRQHWEFDPDAGTSDERDEVDRLRHHFTANRFFQKQSSDALMRMQLRKENGPRKPIPEAVRVKGIEEVTEEAVMMTLHRGIDYLSSIQAQDGHWPSENAGPLYFLFLLIIALDVTGGIDTIFTTEHIKEIKRYIYNHQNEDGGWGLNVEGSSSMFSTTLTYVALRLLGEQAQNEVVSRARNWILDHGGAIGVTLLGKFMLAVLGVYEWDGCNPIPPEFYLVPDFFPLHPGKMMHYCRTVYIPLSYIYSKRFVREITPLVYQLRQELYIQPYHKINWNLARNTCSKEDLYQEHPKVVDILWGFLYNIGEPILKLWPFSNIREKASKVVMEHIHYEDFNSKYFSSACVEKILCLLACWIEDPNSDAYNKFHLARIPDFFWVAEDGLKIQSFGSQMWDTTLAIQAIMSSDLIHEYNDTLRKAHCFVKASQVQENPSGNFKNMYRHISKGAWTFSIQDQGLQVSDCTAEGLKVTLMYSEMPEELVGEKIETEQLYNAVDFILTFQSSNGGFPAWEPRRTYSWIEEYNPLEFIGDILIEREYVECTSSAIQVLVLFKKLHPTYRRQDIEICIEKAHQYILNVQNPDGSWSGNWGICFTYGTWFGVEALKTLGMNYNNCPALRKACEFLLSKQLPDGGWGESYLSYTTKVYTNIDTNRSNLVQTSWALLALIKGGQGMIDPTPIKKGVMLLINSQVEGDGDFPQQEITGAFFRTCTLNYGAYRNVFPVLALGEYKKFMNQYALCSVYRVDNENGVDFVAEVELVTKLELE